MCASCQGTFWVHGVTTAIWGWNWLSDCLDQDVVSVTGVALARDHLASAGDGIVVVGRLITAVGASTRCSYGQEHQNHEYYY